MGDERRINQLTAKAYSNIGSSDYFAVDNASEAESKKLPASSIKTPISNLQGEVTGGSDTYSSTKNYSVGMYATHTTGGVQKLYRCKTACTAAGWTTNASCFEEANLTDAVSQLNNDLTPIKVTIKSDVTLYIIGKLHILDIENFMTTSATAGNICTLSSKYRPTHDIRYYTVRLGSSGTTPAFGRIIIETNGNVSGQTADSAPVSQNGFSAQIIYVID